MDYYSQLNEGEKEPLGRPDTTLPVLLFSEYKRYKQKYKERGWSVNKTKGEMLAELRGIAKEKTKWRKIVDCVCDLDSS